MLSATTRLSYRLARASLTLLVFTIVTGLLLTARADTELRTPTSSADGLVSQLYQAPGETAYMRCALVVSHPVEDVWSVLTDYERYGDICTSVRDASITHDGADACRIEAVGDSVLAGRLPFAVRLTHEKCLDQYAVTWTDAGGAVRNNGRWLLTAIQPAETLVVLEQDVQVRLAPTVMVRALLLPRLRETMQALERRLNDGPSGKPW